MSNADAVPRLKQVLRRGAGIIGPVTGIRTATGCMALTYDDGPEPVQTEAVLAALDDAGVQATFFVLLSRVRLYPQLLAEVVAGGHEIALHGMDHRPLTGRPLADVRRELHAARIELQDRCAAPVQWMRPPYGRQTPLTGLAIRQAGMTPVLWNASSSDSHSVEHDSRLARVRAEAAKGCVLLCHDGFADARDGVDDGPAPAFDRGEFAAAVLAELVQLGLQPGTVGAALNRGTAVREALFRR